MEESPTDDMKLSLTGVLEQRYVQPATHKGHQSKTTVIDQECVNVINQVIPSGTQQIFHKKSALFSFISTTNIVQFRAIYIIH